MQEEIKYLLIKRLELLLTPRIILDYIKLEAYFDPYDYHTVYIKFVKKNSEKIDIHYNNHKKLREDQMIIDLRLQMCKKFSLDINGKYSIIFDIERYGDYTNFPFQVVAKLGYHSYFDRFKNLLTYNLSFFNNLPDDILVSILMEMNEFDIVSFIKTINFTGVRLNNIFKSLITRKSINFNNENRFKEIFNTLSIMIINMKDDYNWYHVYLHFIKFLNEDYFNKYFDYIENFHTKSLNAHDIYLWRTINYPVMYGYLIATKYPIIFQQSLLGNEIFSSKGKGDFFYNYDNSCNNVNLLYNLLKCSDLLFINYIVKDNLYDTHENIETLIKWAINNNFNIQAFMSAASKNELSLRCFYNATDYKITIYQILDSHNIHQVKWFLNKNTDVQNIKNTKGKYNFIQNKKALKNYIMSKIKDKTCPLKFIIDLINLFDVEYQNFDKDELYIEIMNAVRYENI